VVVNSILKGFFFAAECCPTFERPENEDVKDPNVKIGEGKEGGSVNFLQYRVIKNSLGVTAMQPLYKHTREKYEV
jgi:hypothetical protein